MLLNKIVTPFIRGRCRNTVTVVSTLFGHLFGIFIERYYKFHLI